MSRDRAPPPFSDQRFDAAVPRPTIGPGTAVTSNDPWPPICAGVSQLPPPLRDQSGGPTGRAIRRRLAERLDEDVRTSLSSASPAARSHDETHAAARRAPPLQEQTRGMSAARRRSSAQVASPAMISSCPSPQMRQHVLHALIASRPPLTGIRLCDGDGSPRSRSGGAPAGVRQTSISLGKPNSRI